MSHLMDCKTWLCLVASCGLALPGSAQTPADPIAELQSRAVETNQSADLHWGPDPSRYSSWTNHTNRLIPLYTFGINLDEVSGSHSVYRNADALKKLYGTVPTGTLNPKADYFDQTDVFRLQQAAVTQGKKRIILFIMDGTDWQTTRAGSIAKTGKVGYDLGRGSGLSFQDYRGVATDFGYFVVSPHNDGTAVNVDAQRVTSLGKLPGGYSPKAAGNTPWETGDDPKYLIGKGKEFQHAYPDSAATATSMTCGIKTYNNAINVDFTGREVLPISRKLQADGWAIGVVTTVPISHATPACAYANNVHRSDYQDLTRDLLGIPSVFHPGGIPGVDVLMGAGRGDDKPKDGAQGKNFVPGNRYLTAKDQESIDVKNGGLYVIVQRTKGTAGPEVLANATRAAIDGHHRLFGYFGIVGGYGAHLPFRTSDGRYNPVVSVGNNGAAEVYTPEDLRENVTLAQMVTATLDVLDARSKRWWVMIEAGDIDWANHQNNIDNAIGAVLSADEAFTQLTKWIETHGGWQDTCVLVTADHGHFLVLDRPEALVVPQ